VITDFLSSDLARVREENALAVSEFANVHERRSMLGLASHGLRNPISAASIKGFCTNDGSVQK